jgi:hypothetical protein
MSWDEWRGMAEMMGGVAVMGGPATGLGARMRAPVTRAPDMADLRHRGERHHGHAAVPRHGPRAAESDSTVAPRTSGMMMELHRRMMADPGIRQRVMADTALRRLMHEMMATMPPEHRAHMRAMMEGEHQRQPSQPPPGPEPAPAAPKDSTAAHQHAE